MKGNPLEGTLEEILILCSLPDFDERLCKLRSAVAESAVFLFDDPRKAQVQQIVHEVFCRKDAAVTEFTEKFDGVRLKPADFAVSAAEMRKAHDRIDGKLLESLRKAIKNVRRYQSEIFIGDKNRHPGIKYTPIQKVGICVPGASAPLPSTVIMTAVPAQAAGVGQISIVSPPRYKGGIHPVILAVCCELGIERVYRIGGAQAVAALAGGTQTIGKVDKITGPGNQWVQTAKKEVFGLVDIDSIAGPSEVLIIADDSANPAWTAADMLSQAEHDPGSAIVFTDSQKLAENILKELKIQLAGLGRAGATERCLKKYSGVAVFNSLNEAIERADEFAPEHLQIQCGSNSRKISERIRNAGAIFIGNFSPVAVGDYWAGPSHTLPTGTSARFFSALSSNDFIKSSSMIEYDSASLAESADDIIRLAATEGLDAHAKSISIRQKT